MCLNFLAIESICPAFAFKLHLTSVITYFEVASPQRRNPDFSELPALIQYEVHH
jgi:hypothetical protein